MAIGANLVSYIVTEDGMFLDDFISYTMQAFEKHNVKAVGFEVKLKGGHTVSFGIKSKAKQTNRVLANRTKE